MKKIAIAIMVLFVGMILAEIYLLNSKQLNSVRSDRIDFVEEEWQGAGMPCMVVEVQDELQKVEEGSEIHLEKELPELRPTTVDDENGEVASSSELPKETTDICPELDYPTYSVNGCKLQRELEVYLYDRLAEKNIEWWMPYAIMQMYQESNFDTTQVTNNIDKGLLQYRYIYWDEWCDRAGVSNGDIFDPYKQIDVYTEMVRQWLSKGCSVAETISNHNTGGWGNDYSQTYVDQVMHWEDYLETR